MTAQITIHITAGQLLAEIPGRNGQRMKFELPADFATRNPEIMNELREQERLELAAQRQREIDNAGLERAKKHRDSLSRPAVPDDIGKIIAADVAKRAEEEWTNKFNSATACGKFSMLVSREINLIKSQQLSGRKAREIYVSLATIHGFKTANLAVDKSRRPSTVLLADGTRYDTQSEKVIVKKRTKAQRVAAGTPVHVVIGINI